MLKNNIFTAKFNKNWLLKKSINLNFGLSLSVQRIKFSVRPN